MNETQLIDVSERNRRRRERMFSVIAWISLGGFAFLSLVYVVIRLYAPEFPSLPLIVNNTLGMALIALSLRWLRHGRFGRAVALYMLAAHLAFALALYFMDGPTGPLMIAFPILTMFAAVLGGGRAAIGSALGAMVTAVVISILDFYGLAPSMGLQGGYSHLIANVLFFATLVTVNLLLNYFAQTNERALQEVQDRSEELAAAIQRAEEFAQAEHDASQREVRLSQNLQDVVRDYTHFLQQVTEGNYQIRVQVERLAQEEDLPEELVELGRYLNATVESLVQAVTEMEAAQRMYTNRSWEDYVESGATARGYRYRASAEGEAQIESDDDAWLTAMQNAVQRHSLAVEDEQLAIPLDMRGQIIGAIGMRRATAAEWGEDEQALINAITDQLAQTIDNLRLLEDTGRRAARERAASDVAGRIRAEVEIEAVLERALAELGRVLRAERGTAHLTLGKQQED